MSGVLRPAERPGHGLLRVLGPFGATMVVIGSVIGSGIFFKANVIARALGRFDLILLVWIVCGVMSLLGALAAAELGAMMPHAGGQYVYLREAYGPLTGFLWGWGEFWMMRAGSTAALAVAFSTAFYGSAGALFERLGWVRSVDGAAGLLLFGAFPVQLVWVQRGIAIAAIGFLAIVNVLGARWGGLMQNVTTFVKAVTLVLLAVLPFAAGAYGVDNLASSIPRPGGLVAGFGAAMTAAFWAYDGWGNIGPVAEEVRDPRRNIPLALFVGTLVLIGLYLAVTVAYHLVLTMREIADSGFVAATVCERMLGRSGLTVASVAVMLSTFGALNSNILVGPRVVFAMARDRLFIAPMARVHPRYRTPDVAIWGQAVWASALILGSDLLGRVSVPGWVHALPDRLARALEASIGGMQSKAVFDVLTDYVIFGQFVFYTLAVAAVFVLRVRRPDLERPYRAYGYPLLPLLFVLTSAGFLVSMLVTSPIESLAGLMFIGLGAAVYGMRPRGTPPVPPGPAAGAGIFD